MWPIVLQPSVLVCSLKLEGSYSYCMLKQLSNIWTGADGEPTRKLNNFQGRRLSYWSRCTRVIVKDDGDAHLQVVQRYPAHPPSHIACLLFLYAPRYHASVYVYVWPIYCGFLHYENCCVIVQTVGPIVSNNAHKSNKCLKSIMVNSLWSKLYIP